MMKNGSMKESNEKVAELEDIAVNTFNQFVDFCYSKNYRTTRKDPHADEDSEHDGTKIDQPTFKYRDHYGDEEVRVSETEEAVYEVAEDGGYESSLINGSYCNRCSGYCNICGGHLVTTSNKGTRYCRRCFPYEPYADVSSINASAFKDKKYGSTEYTHDQIRTFLDNQMPRDEATTQLTEHARVYVMADKYLVPSLKCMAMHKLHRDLVAYSVSASGAGEVADLLRYTYANTSGTDDELGTDNELRDLVATYAACQAPELLKDRAFREILEEGGEAASGFACFLAKRLM
jgi:heat shock protein HslJ